MREQILRILALIVFSFVISLPLILPYFHSGYFPTHDGEWVVVRAAEMLREIRDHQFPPRYSGVLNFEYGYPLFNFVYPFPYYIATILHFFKFGFVTSIKILFAASVPLSFFFIFLLSKKLWKSSFAGAVSGLLYIYYPYRVVDLYVRGSIGESLAFVLFPLLLYSIIQITERRSFIPITVCSLAALITTHNIMTVEFVPILVLFTATLLWSEKKKNLWPFIKAFCLGIGLSAFFWLPALFEKGNIALSQIPIADRSLYFVTLEKLIAPKWGYGVPTDTNGFSYQIGIPQILIFVFCILYLVFRLSTHKKDSAVKFAFLFAVIAILYILLMFSFTSIIWKSVPLLSEINYPWTLLAPIAFLIALLSGFTVQSKLKFIVLILALGSILFVAPYAKPQTYVNRGDNFYLTNEATTTSSDELMPLWVKEKPNKRWEKKVEVVQGRAGTEDIRFKSNETKFNVAASQDSVVRINTIYYPGWKAYIDGRETTTDYGNKMGVMNLQIPSGNHFVKLSFMETPIRLFADFVSLLSFVVLLAFFLYPSKVQTKPTLRV